jgi:hypothetical protein
MEFNLIVYLIGVVLSMILGLRSVGVFNHQVNYGACDIVLVVFSSLIFHWLTAMVYYFGYEIRTS